MAQSNVFKDFIVNDVEMIYPRLDATYRFNNAEKRSEKCSPNAQGAEWSVTFKMSQDEAKKLYSELQAHYKAASDGKVPFKTVFGMKKVDDHVEFKAKRRGMTQAGNAAREPAVLDGAKKPLADRAIWSGSRGHIAFSAFPVVDPDGQGGISLQLSAVMVTDPVYGSNDPFADIPAGTGFGDDVDDGDPFSNDTAPAGAASNEINDEIPF